MPGSTLPAADTLAPADADRFLADLLRVRAARRAPHVEADETTLLARINAGLPPDEWAEYRRLQAARDAGTLTSADYAALLRLTDRVEDYQANRAAALAAKRGRTLAELADALDLAADGLRT